MGEPEFPTLLARALIAAAPRPAIEIGAAALLAAIGRNHPGLFRVLAEQQRARILVEATDAGRRFLLSYGGGPPSLKLADENAEERADAELKGAFAALLALLEGRSDGDALFFTRELTVAGDMAAVVTLRNVLDRETISVLDDAASLLGPLHYIGRAAALRLERRATRLRDALAPASTAGDDTARLAAEAADLRSQMETLRVRLSKLEARQRRKEGAAA